MGQAALIDANEAKQGTIGNGDGNSGGCGPVPASHVA